MVVRFRASGQPGAAEGGGRLLPLREGRLAAALAATQDAGLRLTHRALQLDSDQSSIRSVDTDGQGRFMGTVHETANGSSAGLQRRVPQPTFGPFGRSAFHSRLLFSIVTSADDGKCGDLRLEFFDLIRRQGEVSRAQVFLQV